MLFSTLEFQNVKGPSNIPKSRIMGKSMAKSDFFTFQESKFSLFKTWNLKFLGTSAELIKFMPREFVNSPKDVP